MRQVLSLFVALGWLGCASAPVLPSVGSNLAPPVGDADTGKHPLPSEPKAQWRVAPASGTGLALELRF